MRRQPFNRPEYFLNSELSWLEFNRRVLHQAEDESNPLLERVKFLAITASNLDEFFEVRIAALLQRIEDGRSDTGPDGISPIELRDTLAERSHDFVREQYDCWARLQTALAEHSVELLHLDEVDESGRAYLADFCRRELDPLLTPVTIDPAHPFPRVLNKSLCQALLMRRRRRASMLYLGVVTAPRSLPRIVKLPASNGGERYVLLSQLVADHAERLFRGFEIVSSAPFRITRNSNLYLQEEESRGLLESVRTELHNRRRGDAVRLEIGDGGNAEVVARLQENFELDEWQVFRVPGPVSLSRLSTLYSLSERSDLKFRPFVSRSFQLRSGDMSMFDHLRKRDVLLHHPFDSYSTVVDFVRAAADDPAVVSIKQTLYRTSEDSPIVEALESAAATKEVAVVVELKARFDEAPNIRWARHLEDVGVQVFHGVVGLKTHAKVCLVARRESDGTVRRYAHFGTGNYNPVTSGLYTDISLLTADEELTAQANKLFNFLTAYAEHPDYGPLLVAPVNLAGRTIQMIDREAEHARAGRPARIIAKCNALTDPAIMDALYRASQAGVSIDLIVRGRCALRPGIRGVSERITVRSIVGRFLEHSRIFYFANGGQEEVYIGSADWMPRNLYERVEAQIPINDPELRRVLIEEVLHVYLADTDKARLLRRDGRYVPQRRTGRFDAQQFLIEVAEGRATAEMPRTPTGRGRKPRRERKQ